MSSKFVALCDDYHVRKDTIVSFKIVDLSYPENGLMTEFWGLVVGYRQAETEYCEVTVLKDEDKSVVINKWHEIIEKVDPQEN